jgi:radical SAM protein with 4Fe4S-binding SPASM domain
MEFFKIYKNLLGLYSFLPYRLASGRAFPPLRCVIELTYRCNLSCPFCYQDKILRRDQELHGREIKALINDLPVYALVTFTGGEPMIRHDILDIIVPAASKRHCTVITNGGLLTETHLQAFVDSGLAMLAVSLEGTEEVHDRLRNKKGLYKSVITSIATLQRLKKEKRKRFPLIEIKTNILNENLENLPDLLRVAQDLEIDYFSLSFLKGSSLQMNPGLIEKSTLADCFPSKSSLIQLDMDMSEVAGALRAVFEVSQRKPSTRLMFYPDFHGMHQLPLLLNMDDRITRRYHRCHNPWFVFRISAYGDVYPCLSYRIGNIRQNSIKVLWNSDRFIAFRKCLQKQGLFTTCERCCYLRLREKAC